jgi:hypothetical protein
MAWVSTRSVFANEEHHLTETFFPNILSVIMQFRFLIPIVLTALNVHAAGLPDKIDYNRDVRPILSNSCYACHGPDSKNNDSDLRLDIRQSAIDEFSAPTPMRKCHRRTRKSRR